MHYEIIFITEASIKIGTGHLSELLILAQSLPKDSSYSFLFYKSDENITSKLPDDCRYTFLNSITDITAILAQKSNSIVLLDTRNNEIELQEEIKNNGNRLVVLDELGDKNIIADILINPSAVTQWHNYTEITPGCKKKIGTKYKIIREEYSLMPDPVFNKINILVTMGGADRTGATLPIIKSLKKVPNLKKTIVIGPIYKTDLKNKITAEIAGRNDFTLLYSPSNLLDAISNSTIVISSGGNTLYEAAAAGRPTIVLYEDEHELVQGKAFEKMGLSFLVGKGINYDETLLLSEIKQLSKNQDLYNICSKACRKIVDGNGAKRIVSLILDD